MTLGRLTVFAGFLFAALLPPVTARADNEPPAPAPIDAPAAGPPAGTAVTRANGLPAAPPAQTHWYGWQTLVVDAASVSLVSLGIAVGLEKPVGDVAFALGIGGYAVGVPAVHALHQGTGMAAASFGIRLGAPLVGTLAVKAFDGKCHQQYVDRADQCLPHLAGGLVASLAVAMALDALLLPWEPAPKASPPSAVSALRVMPFVQEHEGGIVLGATF